ncbi:MAG: hypothetical protein M1823_003568 [Watsoniomyces obsoletus]|nr:MAG: hypothetical protein M1823_003568 [Watsoniomyces obsoletus]
MAKVIIQPSYGNKDARRHWQDTLDQEVPFITDARQSTLTTEQRARLTTYHPTGSARFWGATGNHDARMATLNRGDVILFTGLKIVRAVGEVGYSFHNPAFADTLWDAHPTRGSYTNVYSLLAFQSTDIPYEEIWNLPGFNNGDNFMGLRFLNPEKSDTVLDGLAIRTITAATQEASQQAAQESAVTAILTGGGSEATQIIDAEAMHTTHTSYHRLPGTVLVHRAEALLVTRYRASLNLSEGEGESEVTARRIRTPVGITDLYITGLDAGPELIEAKRAADHQFVRQALGQLLDYVLHAPEPVARLSALFPTSPSAADIALLNRYGIDCLYQDSNGHSSVDRRRRFIVRT